MCDPGDKDFKYPPNGEPNSFTRKQLVYIEDEYNKLVAKDGECTGVVHYGTYDEVAVFRINLVDSFFIGDLPNTVITCGGIEFALQRKFEIYAYKHGNFLKLDEAYERGWISLENIKACAEYHKNLEPLPSFEPFIIDIPKNEAAGGMSKSNLNSFRKELKERYGAEFDENSLYHYGTYNGAAVFLRKGNTNATVNNVGSKSLPLALVLESGGSFIVYKNGEFYTDTAEKHSVFRSAKEKGILTESDVLSILWYNNETLPKNLKPVSIDVPDNASGGTLSQNVINKLKSQYSAFYDDTFDDMVHYGTYGGYFLLVLKNSNNKYAKASYKIGGHTLVFDTPSMLMIYRNGQMFLGFNEYKDVIFSERHLDDIVEYHDSLK